MVLASQQVGAPAGAGQVAWITNVACICANAGRGSRADGGMGRHGLGSIVDEMLCSATHGGKSRGGGRVRGMTRGSHGACLSVTPREGEQGRGNRSWAIVGLAWPRGHGRLPGESWATKLG